MSVTVSASDESDIDATVDICVNQDVRVQVVGADEQALADDVKVASDEEDHAADKQMLALYDADPVKTEEQFGVDANFIQELREHVAEVEMRRASHSHGHGGETSAVLPQNIEQMQPRRAKESATLSASDESDIDVTVDSFVNQESEDKEDDAEVIVCCL